MSNKEMMKEFLDKINNFNLPDWEKLPDLDLYMDQIVTYISRSVNGVTEKNCITDSMINNYVKGKIIPPPNQKKYNSSHIAQIFGIVFLKAILPISDIKKLFGDNSKANEQYLYIQESLSKALINVYQEMEEELINFNLDDENSIKLLALEYAIKAYASKMVSTQLLSLIEDKEDEEKIEKDKVKEKNKDVVKVKESKKKDKNNLDNMLESEKK